MLVDPRRIAMIEPRAFDSSSLSDCGLVLSATTVVLGPPALCSSSVNSWVVSLASSSPCVPLPAGATTAPLVADVLGSVQTFLLEMDWNSPERNLVEEAVSFRRIFAEITGIDNNIHTRHLITPNLVDALGKTREAGMCIVHSTSFF